SLCPAPLRSPRFCRCCSALTCFAIPRRHRSAARPALGRHHERVGDQFLRRFLSFLHLRDLLLARADFAICSGWHGRWRPSRLAWFDFYPSGKSLSWYLLLSEPLSRPPHSSSNPC